MKDIIKREIIKKHALYGERFGAYFYDLEDITDKINNIKKHAPANLSLYYAMKANPNFKILKHVAANSYIKGFEIASNGEYKKAIKVMSPKQLLFTGPGKRYDELELVINNKISLINVESETEIKKIIKIACEKNILVPVLIRINPNYYINGCREHMTGIPSKLGIDEQEIVNIFSKYYDHPNLEIKGLHVYGASGILDYKILIQYIKYIFDFAKKNIIPNFKISIIDFGGGLGVDYSLNKVTFDVAGFFKIFNNLVLKYEMQDFEFIMELGTYLVAECGYYAAHVIDIKHNKNHNYAIITGGLNHIGISKDLGIKNPISIINVNNDLFQNTVVRNDYIDICGPLCYSGDKISWDDYVEKVSVGDIVVVHLAGAYCYSFSLLNFLSHDYPREYIIKR